MSDRLDLKGFQKGTLVVQLTDITRGIYLLYNGESVIVTNPFSVSLKPVDYHMRYIY